ncbi:ribonuclease H [Paenibacillus thermotolerans]|uniref:ribonuclease H n=1 Tax=Paenibacillus thermotolerans TaxID=3027807 RepID=UPI0023681F2C|nr:MULTISPECIES: viroplasmin family protein [unclassified Paenibacillus]
MAQSKYYVVWVGREPGIYETWNDCKAQVDGFQGAKYKSFPSKSEAQQAYETGWAKTFAASAKIAAQSAGAKTGSSGSGSAAAANYDLDSICVDAASSGNPGIVEYQGVDTRTGERLFHNGPIPKGTNNLGEFLAIVHGLAYLKQQGSGKTIYSDSRTAIKWVREKHVATTLVRDASTEEIWRLVDRALAWLRGNPYRNKIVKWETEAWGEIKADFGRK